MLRCDPLETRSAPVLALSIEYSASFFADPAARATFDAAANLYAQALTGPALTLRVDVAPLIEGRVAQAGPRPGGAGAVTFDADTPWHFGGSLTGLDRHEFDFYTVALHELGHVFGVGTVPAWDAQVRDGAFHGARAVAVYGAPVPLTADGDHWRDGVTIGGRETAYDPTVAPGVRVPLTAIDAAALADLGYAVDLAAIVSPIPAPAVPFPGYAGPVQLAAGDVTGDGPPDWVAAPAVGAHVKVFDGATGREARSFFAYDGYRGEMTFGVGDVTGDGRADVLTAANNRHLKTFDGATGAAARSEIAP